MGRSRRCHGSRPRQGGEQAHAGPGTTASGPAGGNAREPPRCRQNSGHEIAERRPSAGPINRLDQAFPDDARRVGTETIAGYSRREYTRVLPDCRPGSRRRPGDRLDFLAAPARSGWARTERGGYPLIQPGLLPRAVPRTGVCPSQSSARQSVRLITHGNIGSAGPAGPFAGPDSCRSATFWCGYASVCWRSC